MLFSSYLFVFCFLPAALAGFAALARFAGRAAAALWLVGASFFFYGWWTSSFRPPAGGFDRIQLRGGAADRLRRLKAADSVRPAWVRHCLRSRRLGLFQIFGVGPRVPAAARVDRVYAGGPSAAARDQLLHLHPGRLPDRHAPRRGSGEGPAELSPVRHLLPAPDRRTGAAPSRDDAAIRRPGDVSALGREHRGRPDDLLDRAGQEGARRPAFGYRRGGLFQRGPACAAARLGSGPRVLAAAVFRLLRLLGHGDRNRPPVQCAVPGELQLALQGAERHRLLAALAHDADALSDALSLQSDLAPDRATPGGTRATDRPAAIRHRIRRDGTWSRPSSP